MRVRLLSLGAAIRSLEVPDATGALGDVHLHLPTAIDYADVSLNPHLGATIGRYANRIANGHFTIDGRQYQVDVNRPPATLHGGTWGYDRLVWSIASAVSTADVDHVVFELHSPDGDMGFPGNLTARAEYEVRDSTVTLRYRAECDQPTPVSLTNHGYWNLSGAPTVADHTLQVMAARALEVDEHTLPTGTMIDVATTPLDLLSPTNLGEALTTLPSGFDHCYVADSWASDELRPIAVLAGGTRWMSVATDCPGVQVYTGNALHPPFAVHQSVSLETQRLPDAPNHDGFGPWLLLPGEEYRSTTVLTFGVGEAPWVTAD